MSRADAQMDAMLRHLGAAYYESLHGRASAADVTRARTAVEENLAERPGAAKRAGVGPVLVMGRHVAGVVSETDLLAVEDQVARQVRARGSGRLRWPHRPGGQALRLKAEDLMSKPAVTINPDAPIPQAAAVMHAHHVKRLPVVDSDGRLIGIVSRRDLLSVFLRSDAQIADEVRELLSEILFADPAAIKVIVHGGVVALLGEPGSQDHHDLIPVAIRLIREIDGVVDVVDKLATDTNPAHEIPRPA